MRFRIPFALVLALSIGCKAADGPPQGPPLPTLPVDTKLGISPGEVPGWGYRRELRADLNGDGSDELLVLAADVEVDARQRPLWEDGHRWAMVVQEGGRGTLVFASFVPNGFVEAALLGKDSAGLREVLIQERTPSQARSIVVSYQRPGEAREVSAAHYQIEQWLPGSARLFE